MLRVHITDETGPYWPCCSRHARTGIDHQHCETGSPGTLAHPSSYGPRCEVCGAADQPVQPFLPDSPFAVCRDAVACLDRLDARNRAR